MLSFAVKYGQVYPKLETIARLVRCSKRTVCNALAWLRLWGFLDWQRRIKRVVTRLGTMVRQASNAYRLKLSGLAAIGTAIFSRRAECNNTPPSPPQGPQSRVWDQERQESA